MGFWSRSKKSRKKSKSAPRRYGLRPEIETLENRDLLNGTWTPLTNLIPDPDGAQTAILLSDGSVMVLAGSDNASNIWYKLTPDSSGNYANGTWSQLATSNVQRLFAPMALLPNGDVFIMGGEYSGPNTTENLNNTGEIYDPVANTWTMVSAFPQSVFGDDPIEVLPDGNVLTGFIFDSSTNIYDPTTNSWITGPNKLRGDRSDEEAWVKLPNGNILSYDIFASISSGVSSGAQVYNPTLNEWEDANTITDGSGNPVFLSSPTVGYELGPAMLLPDGRVFQLGATGNTAYYTPSTNSWAEGPAIPNSLIASDDPAAMLTNGDELMAVSPFAAGSSGGLDFPGPTTVFEFNPLTNTYTNVTPNPSIFDLSQGNNLNAFATSMLDLPSGQVLMMNDTRQLAVFTPDGSPQASWAPTITNIQRSGSTYTLTGTQLNGISEGAGYGDDWAMASNYPLIQLTNINNGDVAYARSVNWSSTGVQTGSLSETVNFTLPLGVSPGTYLLSVDANGITSTPELVVLGSNAGDTINISNTAVTFNNAVTFYTGSQIVGIDVFDGSGFNTVTVQSTVSGVPVNIFGGANGEQFNLGTPGVTNGILSTINVNGGGGTDTLTVNDNLDTSARTITITSTQIGSASGDNLFGAGGVLNYTNVGKLVVNGGTGGNQIDLLSMNSGEVVDLFAGTGANQIFVGSKGSGSGSLQNILGQVNVTGQGAATALTIDGGSGTTANTLTLTGTTVSSAANNFFGAGGSLAYTGLASLTLNEGSGNNQIQVLGTAAGATTNINPGAGIDNIMVDSTPGNPTGDVNEILSSLIIDAGSGNNALLVEDRNDTASKTFTITSTQIGAAAGDNLFGTGGSLTYSGISNLTVNGSAGGNTIFLQGSPTGTLDLYSGNGNNSIVLGSGGASSTVAGIGGVVMLDGGAGANNTLTIENEGSANANVVTVTPTTVGAAVGDSFFPAGGSLTYLDIQTLTIDTSNADPGDSITVFPSTFTTFNVNAGDPLPPTFPGDNLFINLTGITGATLTPTGIGTGNWSFSNAQTVNFSGIEKQDNVTRLAGVVFQDFNGNGVMDAGDTGISGVTVTLLDSSNNQVAQTTTDSSGNYQFFIGVGTYHVVETLPAGVIQTTTPPPSETIIFGTPDVTTLDFGNFTLVTIGGQVFQDSNGNGVDDSGEPGLQGWTVELETTTGAIEQTATTDVNGDYSFANLLPGTYRVREIGQSGWLQTTGDPADFVIASGTNQTSVNFGNFQLITIGGELFNDLNGNGVLDGNESGVAGWTVDLFLNGALNETTTTDTNGNFSFANLTPGTYRVRVELQTNWVTTNTPPDIPASSGQNQTSENLGVFNQFSLSGEVYFDANANGTLDSGETGMQGWTVYLDTNGNGQLDPGEPSTVTDANGDYSFTNLGPGNYQVREVLQPGFAQTSATPAGIVGQSGLDQTATFGNFQIVTISGQVFNDSNGNGSNEAGDAGLQGWTVFLDANGNGQLDPGELSTTTDSNGDFSFQVAFTGTVRLAEVVKSGWVQTTTQSLITLQAGLVVSQDIGNFQTISITSQVFVDLNGNGNSDGGTEPGKDGVQISLYADVNNNGIFDASVDTLVATSTSAKVGSQDGIYSFTGVTPGAYFLVEAPVSGSAQSDPPLPGYYAFTVQSGMDITGKDFGNLNGVNPSFLAAVYLDLFDRRIDSAGLNYWSAVLDRGVSRALVVHELSASPEGYTDEVNSLYEEYLGRSADPGGLAYGIKLLSTQPPPNGFTPQQLLKDLLLGSSEYFITQAGQSNAQWVTTMYKAVTGSTPNVSTAASLLGELNSGMDRGSVAIQVLRSNPGYDFVVENYYQQLLKRNADAGGLAFFVGTLQNGGQELDIEQALLGSDEFFSSL